MDINITKKINKKEKKISYPVILKSNFKKIVIEKETKMPLWEKLSRSSRD